MTRLALAAALLLAATPAFAQNWTGTGTITPYGASIYGGPPQGYSFQYQNNSGSLLDAGRNWVEQLRPPQSRTCYACD
jgi:hypothetical protein